MITKKQYLANPCRQSSIPYWKTKNMMLPEGIIILHHDYFNESKYYQYINEPYFRLFHSLENLSPPQMPEGFVSCDITLKEYADHINSCYDDIGISESELYRYTMRPMYNAKLWIAVKDKQSGTIVATGIAELDREIDEEVLEWIQVSEEYRRCGLGFYLVSELLWRMRCLASFATVSGQCNNATNPERLYRKCGFIGTDVWHVLRKRTAHLLTE